MYNVRYHQESNTYYLQIKSKEHAQLKRKLQRINAHLSHLHDTQSEEWRCLARKRALLQRQARESLRYVRIREQDIPPNAHIRPLYIMEGEIVTVSAPGYDKLISKIRIDPPEETADASDQT